MTLPRALYGWQGPGETVDVFTDTGIDKTDLGVKVGREAVARTPSNVLGYVGDAEDAYTGERVEDYALRLRAIRRLLRKPVSAYCNVMPHVPSWRIRYGLDMLAKGAETMLGWPQRGWWSDQVYGNAEDFVIRPLLDNSDWCVFQAYFLDDATQPWMDLAIVHAGAAICREVAPDKPIVVYVSPVLYTTKMKPLGLVPVDRMASLVKGSPHDVSLLMYGFTGEGRPEKGEYSAEDVRAYWDVMRAA